MDWAAISAATALLGAAITIWTVISTRNDLMRQIRADQLAKTLEALVDDLTEFGMLEYRVTAETAGARAGLRPPYPSNKDEEELQRKLSVLRDKLMLRLPPSDPDLAEVARRLAALESNREIGAWFDLHRALIESARDAFARKQRAVGSA